MLKPISKLQNQIKVGTHGEDYGSWMSNPVFYVFGAGTLIASVLAVLLFTVFHAPRAWRRISRRYRRFARDAGLDFMDSSPVRVR